jgi:hypothetical protein
MHIEFSRGVHDFRVCSCSRSRDVARNRFLVASTALGFLTAGAHAQDASTPTFSLSGFGTVGEVHSSEDRADFTASSLKARGAGFSTDWSGDVDSLLAVQLTANLTPKLSATLQIVSDENYTNSYRPRVEWATIKYQITPDFSVRVGRTVLPFFMVSDSRAVGYANPWVRPPLEVYDLVPITTTDGFDASYRLTLGASTNTFQITGGQSDKSFPAGSGGTPETVNIRKLRAFSDTFEHGFLTAHVSYGAARLTIEQLEPLFDAFRQFGPQGVAIDDKYAIDGKVSNFFAIGASYDPGKWFVLGEWGHVDTHSILGASTGWYGTGGYRFGKFTPYATYGSVQADSNRSDQGLSLSGLPPNLIGPAIGLNAALNSTLSAVAVQRTISIGTRWDFTKRAAFKVQFDRVDLGAGSQGILVNAQPSFKPGGSLNVFSVSVDFVF